MVSRESGVGMREGTVRNRGQMERAGFAISRGLLLARDCCGMIEGP